MVQIARVVSTISLGKNIKEEFLMKVGKKYVRLMAFMLSFLMLLSNCPLSVFAADTITQGLWTITNDTASGEAVYGETDFTYHSPTSTITYGSNGGKDYIRSNSTNGSASNGIVVTNNKSYCDFTPDKEGTLTVYVGNASSKQGYVSRTGITDNKSEAIGSYVPGGSGDYDTTDFKVTQGTTWTTLEIEVDPGYIYYVNLSGSKMFCYGAEFVPYTQVSGSVTDKTGTFSSTDYTIKFNNKTTSQSVLTQVKDGKYSVNLKPGYEYSVALTGAYATEYAFSNDTRLITVSGANQTADLSIEKSISYTVSGSLSGIAAGYNAKDMKLVFVPEDSASFENVTATLNLDEMTYSALLCANEEYTLTLVGAYDYKISQQVKVNNSDSTAVTKNVTFTAVPTYAVGGKFLGLTDVRGEYATLNVNPTAISFKNVEDNYTYSGSVANNTYSVSLRNGSYIANITADRYSTSTHVVVNDGAVTRDLLLKDISNTPVAYTDTLYVGSDKAYKSVQSAVNAVEKMDRTEGQRVTIKIDPGTYREQVVVNTPNITLESNGGTRDNTKISWYYGIGYKYYSCVNSYYDPYADYDKFEKGNVVKYWGSAVITNKTAEGFRAENITFENSFNKYMTNEEITDGAEPNGLESISVARKETTNVDSRAATERAAALVNYADKTEFKACSFIGSQDTLYTCNVAYDAYYKNCYIEGQTDFIYGNGDVIFDGCEINFCGYDGTEAAGYLTANSCSKSYMAENGYIFRGCFISYSDERDVTPGYWGRMWGDSAKVAFINTQLQEQNMILSQGWMAMSVDPTSADVTLKEYNTTYNGVAVTTSGRVNGAVSSIDSDDYSVEKVFINNGWTPAYYTTDGTTAPTFATAPSMTSNGDLNTPNPGETVTLGYTLDTNNKDEDASRISWYAVDTAYDNSSLDTILKSATLLKVESAVSTNKFQIPMECAGKYIMAVVTPVAINGLTGTPSYIIDTEKPVSSTWSDPDNEGSIAPGSGINIYLAGDSTVKDYSAEGIYNGGKILDQGSWGEFLQLFFDENYVTVNNYAQGGRSSRSFINEGKLDTIISKIKTGDYLLIQFGHNDCANGASYYEERFAPLYTKDNPQTEAGYPTIVPTQSMKTATPSALQSSYGSTYYSWDCGATYKGYLQKYIDEALEKGAIPVIVSPVARLYYNSDGTIKTHHDATMTDYAPTADYLTSNDAYVTACKELYTENKAKGNNVLYLDAFNLTKTLYQDAYTAGGSAYGEAVMSAGDKTHSNKTGGVIQAGLLAKWFKDNSLSVSDYVIQPETAYGENSDGKYIFTIKNSVFTANDNAYAKHSYWTDYGQSLFDSIGGSSSVNTVTLNFATDDALALYETNGATTFTDGVYSGKYTNGTGDKYDVSVYKSGIQYYNSSISYGTKASPKKPIFSFIADKAANYSINVTASTGSGTIGLYTDMACTKPVATAVSTQTLTYKKTTSQAEVLYFATPDAGNMYLKEATISHVVPKTMTLEFGTDTALAMYETNAEETFADGVCTGTYTNTDGQSFDVSVYKSGIAYYNSTAHYGTKLMPNAPIFSFVADEKAMYTITATVSTSATTAGLYRDAACTDLIVEGSVPGSLVYKKTTSASETVYFGTTVAGNAYLPSVTITKSDLPDDVKVKFTGEISGIESDDTNVKITLKGSTETLNVNADAYSTEGIELIVGETYTVSAKGDKGIYLGTDIVTDESGVANLVLSRIVFDFPFDFVDNYDDYKAYFSATGYDSGDVTDAYSGVTAHRNGVVMTDSYKEQYGVKTNAYKILSFKAKETGACTVTVTTTVSNSDKLILKVNDVYAPNLVLATGNSEIKLSVMVNKDDVITLYTPTRSNLWYKTIDVAYTKAAFNNINTVVNENEALIYGCIPESMVSNINKVGFYYSSAPVSGFEGCSVADESNMVYSKLSYNGNTYTVADNMLFGTILTDLDKSEGVYVYTYCETIDGSVYYSAPVQIKID